MDRDSLINKRIAGNVSLSDGAEYQSPIKPRDFNSRGTTALIRDWKTGRMVSCLSQGEAYLYYTLRWDDDNIDIREQYPLDPSITTRLAEETGIAHPGGPHHIMTTDFLVSRADGTRTAYAVKVNDHLNKRTIEVLYLEKLYWEAMGCEFEIKYKVDMNPTLVSNIRMITNYYDPKTVIGEDPYSLIKHRIATKELIVDMESSLLTNDYLDQFKEV